MTATVMEILEGVRRLSADGRYRSGEKVRMMAAKDVFIA